MVKTMIDLREFEKISSSYRLPRFVLKKDVGLVEESTSQWLHFVKGDKDGREQAQPGIVSESLITVLIDHLTELNVGDLRNRETSVAITKLQEALFWIEERKRDRVKRGVAGTYKK